MEKYKKQLEVGKYLLGFGLVAIALVGAFSPEVRQEILERDDYTCQDCGATNVRLHASHKNHDRSHPKYDHPRMGETLCVECHLKFHQDHIGKAKKIGLTEEQNRWAMKKLAKRLLE